MPGLGDDYSAIGLRQQYPQDQFMQNLLAPVEHRQFMQEVTRDNPLMGTLLLGASPLYTGLKSLGINIADDKSSLTSTPSLDELFGALDGYLRGLGI